MFCDQCGAPLQGGQQHCARCGKPVIGRVEAIYVQKNRVQEHVRLLGILWMAYSALNVVGGIILVVISNTLFGRLSHAGPPPEVTMWLRPFLTVIGCLILAKAAAGLIAGWGLLQREPWGRILTLVVGFISLFNIPIGTALGVYTLWVLLPARSDEEYRAFSQAQAA
ncbi:MAG TPA: zinc ribbon domain-containing protein [Terriglobales bacterium]|nr:zinc ribbon domain-containing protein [Terriglobales bacterium]